MSGMPRVGDELAGFRLLSVLGRGGMGVVFQAENPRIGSIVALKVLSPDLAEDDVFRARFLQESRIAASLSHPNVVPIYDMGTYEDLIYIAMRYIAGSDLRRILDSQHHLPPEQAVLLVGQAGRALDFAHQHDLVHRDVKPANILVEPGVDGDPDHAYLADFGISKRALSSSGLTATGEFMGTIDYNAPEQIQGKQVDKRADVYSLGCVMYECLTGRVPFVKDVGAAIIWAHVEENAAPVSQVRGELPTALDPVMRRVLAKDPAERYATCREFTDAVRGALAAEKSPAFTVTGQRQEAEALPAPPAPSSSPPAPGATPQQDGGKKRTLVAAGIAALVAVVGVGLWVGLHKDSSNAATHGGSAHSTHEKSKAGSSDALMTALADANASSEAKGMIPPDSCRRKSTTTVVCTHPAPFVNEVSFQAFPSTAALYQAYQASAAAKSGGAGFRPNVRDCSYRSPSGEVSWNHNYEHPREYSVAQLVADKLPPDKAAGRVFCNLLKSEFTMVWAQNEGRLLGTMSGTVHGDAYLWWRHVHHAISLGDMGHMHMGS